MPSILVIGSDELFRERVSGYLSAHHGDRYRIVAALEYEPDDSELALAIVGLGDPISKSMATLRAITATSSDTKRLLICTSVESSLAVGGISSGYVDQFMLAPDSLDDDLEPTVADLLGDWEANHPTDAVVFVAGSRWSPDTHEVRDFLARNQIPHRFGDVESNREAARVVTEAGDERNAMPVVRLPDGTVLIRPTTLAIAEQLGMQTNPTEQFYDLVVIGGGPAGLGAAVYGASEGLTTALVEREATGGQAGTSSNIENYLGFPSGISGEDLARRATAQALKFGVEIIEPVEVAEIVVDESIRLIRLSNGTEIGCHAVVVATGMTVRRLDIPGHDDLLGAGIYYGSAPAEAPEYRGNSVHVVGGANSAGQASLMLAKFAGKVTLLVREKRIDEHMSQYLVDHIADTENIEVLTSTGVAGVRGDERMTEIVLEDLEAGETSATPSDAMFIFIGFVPHSDVLNGLVALNSHGFVLTGAAAATPDAPIPWPLERDPYPMETSIPGVFAAGDVRADVVRRVASAVGQGAVCVQMVHRYLEKG